MENTTAKRTPTPRRRKSRKDALLRGGHAVEAVGRAVRKCEAEGVAALRAPLPEPRHEAFALALFSEPTVTEAAKAAGYSPATARQQGSRLLTGQVDIRRRVFGIYLDAYRGFRRQVLDKSDALARATERHAGRRRLRMPSWRLIGLTAEECGVELRRLDAEGWDTSLVEPMMKLCREYEVLRDGDGNPMMGPGGVLKVERMVARCESVGLPDERDEEAHIGRFLGWTPERDAGDGAREISRLRGEVRQYEGPEDALPVIETPEDAEFPRGDATEK